MNYLYFTQLCTTLHSLPLRIRHLESLLMMHLFHMGNPIFMDKIPRSLCGCGFQQFIILLCKACNYSIEFSLKGGFLLLFLLWDFCLHLRSGFQAHAWRDEVVYGRPESRPGIRSLEFYSQLCPLLVA